MGTSSLQMGINFLKPGSACTPRLLSTFVQNCRGSKHRVLHLERRTCRVHLVLTTGQTRVATTKQSEGVVGLDGSSGERGPVSPPPRRGRLDGVGAGITCDGGKAGTLRDSTPGGDPGCWYRGHDLPVTPEDGGLSYDHYQPVSSMRPGLRTK